MKKLLPLFAAIVLSGCCSIETTQSNGRTMCVVCNYGWRLWDILPIISGDPDSPRESGCVWFSDTITLENNQKLLDRAMKRVGASGVRFLNSYMTDEQTLLTFYRRSYYTSAEFLFDPSGEEEKAVEESAE